MNHPSWKKSLSQTQTVAENHSWTHQDPADTAASQLHVYSSGNISEEEGKDLRATMPGSLL